jgi:hypothetical protein
MIDQLSQLNDIVQRSGLDDKRKRNEAIRQGMTDPTSFEQNYSKEIQESYQPTELGNNWSQGVSQYHNLFDRWTDFGSNVTYGQDAFEPFSDSYLRPGGELSFPTDGTENMIGGVANNLETYMRPQWKGAEEGGALGKQYAQQTPWYNDFTNWYSDFGTNLGDRDIFDFMYEQPDMVGSALARSWNPLQLIEGMAGGTTPAGQQLKDLFSNYNISGSQRGADLAHRTTSEYAASQDDDSFLGGLLGPIASIASIIPGPWQPIAMAVNAANALANDNPLGAILSVANMSGFGLGDIFGGGMDPGSLNAVNGMDLASDMAQGVSPSLSSQFTNLIQDFSNTSGIPSNALMSGGLGALMSAAKGGNPLTAGTIEGLSSMFGGQFGGAEGRAAQMASSFGLNQLMNKNQQTPGQQSINSMLATMPVVNQGAAPQSQMTEQDKQRQLQQLKYLSSLYSR